MIRQLFMLRHFLLLYFFIFILIGVISLAITSGVYFKSRDRLLKYFLYFYIAFSIDLIISAILLYTSTNVTENFPIWSDILDYIAEIIHYIFIFTIPLFAHEICKVPDRKIRNRIFAGVTVFLILNFHYFEFVIADKNLHKLGDYIEDGVFIAILIYVSVTTVYYHKNISPNIRKYLSKKIMVLMGICIIGVIVIDILPNDIPSIIFPQLLYGGFGLIFLFYVIRYHFLPDEYIAVSSKDDKEIDVSQDTFFDSYQISPREREIADFILKGYKSRHIADELCIALSTVKTHIRNIYPKFGVSSRIEFLLLYNNAQSVEKSS
jgi:DNA-binding CsgD family transcriptional regulator